MWYRTVPPSDWQGSIFTFSRPADAAQELFEAWVYGKLELTLEQERTLGAQLKNMDSALPRSLESIIHFEDSERFVRRWAWAPKLFLSPQDEDLLLMQDELLKPLLEEAAHGAPKQGYIRDIVAHHCRDSFHHALWPRGAGSGEGPNDDVFAGVLGCLELAASLVDAIDAPEPKAYLERLASYRGLHEVDRDEAIQRVLDARRCSPRLDEPVNLQKQGETWVAKLKQANLIPGELIIEASTGKMWGRLQSLPNERVGPRQP